MMNMKITVFAALAAIAGAAGAADPTVAEDAMADHLGSRAAVSPALALKAPGPSAPAWRCWWR